MVIKLYSPNIKHRGGGASNVNATQNVITPSNAEKPFYPISMRLLRVVSVLIQKYYSLLVSPNTIIQFISPFLY